MFDIIADTFACHAVGGQEIERWRERKRESGRERQKEEGEREKGK